MAEEEGRSKLTGPFFLLKGVEEEGVAESWYGVAEWDEEASEEGVA
jgi:hypothetical protein